ncbi:MAG TPA: hypothetical protein VEC12_02885 [Bacteroidia bacterium]|nr:hypothetical protein [Bacteroidia bacterium]
MKKAGIALSVLFVCSFNFLLSQSLGHDYMGNSPLVFPSGHVSVDVPSTLVSASYHHISNSRHKLTGGLWGLSLAGRERPGMGSLLNYGPTATEVSAAFTAGFSVANEYVNKYKPADEYKAILENAAVASQKQLLSLQYDTVWINDHLRSILVKYPVYADTLRTIYFETGPERKLLFSKWREYARTVPEAAGGEQFREQVNTLIEKMQFDPVFSHYKDESAALSSVQKQLQNINVPAKPFRRFIIFGRLGIRALSYNTVKFFKRSFTDSTAAFEKKTAEFPAFTIGVTHHIDNNFFLAYSFGINVVDNFETLSPQTVDTSRTFIEQRWQNRTCTTGVYRRIKEN